MKPALANALKILAAMSAIALAAAPGRADENWYLARITCVPDVRLFQIGRVHLTNIPHDGPYLDRDGRPRDSAEETLARSAGLHSSWMLKRHPADCIVPAQKDHDTGDRPAFAVRVRGDVKRDAAIVELDGKPVERIDLAQTDGWKGFDSITIRDDGVAVTIEICTLGAGSESDRACTDHYATKVD